MIPHDDELVQPEATFAAVVSEDVEQEITERLGLKNQTAFEGDRCCEEGSDFLRSEGHERGGIYITRGARVAPALKRIVLAIRDCREAWKASLPRMNAGASTSVRYRGQIGLAEAPEKLGLPRDMGHPLSGSLVRRPQRERLGHPPVSKIWLLD